jgi:hypothetical protein
VTFFRKLVLVCAIATGCEACTYVGSQRVITPDLTGNDPHWIKAYNRDCWLYDPKAHTEVILVWSGSCQDKLVSGFGQQQWYSGLNPDGSYSADKLIQTITVSATRGVAQGPAHLEDHNGSFSAVFENGVAKNIVRPATAPSQNGYLPVYGQPPDTPPPLGVTGDPRLDNTPPRATE